MNSRLPLPLIICAGLTVTSCDKTPPAAPAPAPAIVTEVPLPAGPTEGEQKLQQQVRDLEIQQTELRRRLEEDRLEAASREIAKERDLLERERRAFLLEQQLAESKAAVESKAAAEESGRKDRPRPAAPAGGREQSGDYRLFYEELDDYGSWFQSADYGYVWQPAAYVSNPSWRPYTLGRWVSTDQDWTWYSDEPFGWACYHYGRWAFLDGRGWIWVPGGQWAPAWVSWRRNDTHVGWCPLPPETVYASHVTYGSSVDRDCGIHPGGYVFVPVKHFDQPVPAHFAAAQVSVSIYQTTVNITNITVRPGGVICAGPARDWIAREVRRPVPRYEVAWDGGRPGRGGHGLSLEENRVRFYAPRVQAPWNAELRPSRDAGSLAGAPVRRGEGGISPGLASRFAAERREYREQAHKLSGVTGQQIMERQQRLAELEKARAALAEAAPHRPAEGTRPENPVRPEPAVSAQGAQEVPAGGPATVPPVREPRPGESGKPPGRGTPVPPVPAGEEKAPATEEKAPPVREPRPGESGKPPGRGTPVPPAPAGEEKAPATEEKAPPVREPRPGESGKPPGRGTPVPPVPAGEEKAPATEEKAPPVALPDPGAGRRALEEKRRILEQRAAEAREARAAAERAALERSRSEAVPASREGGRSLSPATPDAPQESFRNPPASGRQDSAVPRPSRDDGRRILEERAAAARQAKEEAAAQREAMDQQRRRSEAADALEERRAREQEQQRAAMENRAREAAAQREAMDQQRRRSEAAALEERRAREQEQQRAAMENRAREAAAQQRAAMEEQRRQFQEQAGARREAESRAALERQSRREAPRQPEPAPRNKGGETSGEKQPSPGN